MTTAEAVEQYGRLVLDAAWRVTRCEETARDVYQETFLKLHAELQQGREIQYPKAWLYRTAVRAAFKRLRERRWHVELELEQLETWKPGELEEAERQQLLAEIRERVTALPQRQQEAFVLRYYEGLDYDEIGHVLSCAPVTARAAVSHALKKLRCWLCASETILPMESKK